MSSSVLSQVGQYQKRILVCLVRVLGRIARFGCKGKLGDAIIKLFAGLSGLHRLVLGCCCNFLWYGCSHIVMSVLASFGRFWHDIYLLSRLVRDELTLSVVSWSARNIDSVIGLLSITFAWNSARGWLSPAIVPLTLCAYLFFVSFLGSQRPQMCLFLRLFQHLVFLCFRQAWAHAQGGVRSTCLDSAELLGLLRQVICLRGCLNCVPNTVIL